MSRSENDNDAVAQRIAGLPPEKRALLEKMLRERKSHASAGISIPQRVPGEPVPLTFSQRRLWFFEQMESGTTVYNGPVHHRLRGRFSVDAMARALGQLVRRHESLRTTIGIREGQPVQQVGEPFDPLGPVEDLSQLPAAEAEAEAIKRAELDRAQPFQIDGGRLFRCRLLKLGETDHVLLIAIHHIVFDGWSTGLLQRDLFKLYAAEASGRSAELPAMPIQYADYAVWQRSAAMQETIQRQIAYWKARLQGGPVLELPLDVARPPEQTFRGGFVQAQVSEASLERIRSLAQQEGVTLYMLLLAAWSLLLGRLSGQEDVVVGSPIAGRTRQEMENIIGFFVNTLAVRTELAGDVSFRALLARVRQAVTEAFSNQDLPFDQVVAAVATTRDLSRSPVFQVMFNLLNFGGDSGEGVRESGLRVEPFPPSESSDSGAAESKFEMTLYAMEMRNGLRLVLSYNRDLFGEPRMRCTLAQFLGVLEQAVAAPDAAISGLSLRVSDGSGLLPDPVRLIEPVAEVPVPLQFNRVARLHAAREAVVDSDGCWSYAELERVSNRIASWLCRQGVGRGACVAVHFPRSAALAAALLGVMKSGAAFLVLDPAYPAQRLADYCSVVRPSAWIFSRSLPLPACGGGVLAEGRVPGLSLGPGPGDPSDCDGEPEVAPRIELDLDEIAYYAFTSGSTGRPKAVAGSHRPLAHFFRWHIERHGFGPADRFSMFSGLAHDPLLRDVFTPLLVGASLRVPPAAGAATGSWGEWMREQRISVAHLTPPLGRLLLQELPAQAETPSLPELKWAFFGGDSLLRSDVARFRSAAPGVRCVSFYGATETPQAMAFWEEPSSSAAAPPTEPAAAVLPERVPLGRGIDGVDLWVVGKTGQPAGVGELGEILVHTPYLTRGYVGDESATREKFLKHPGSPSSSARLYRTGDLGRYRPDGSVEFAGRSDHQVKVRGFRVELDEVAAALSACSGVRQAVAVLRPDASGTGSLVGYVAVGDVGLTRPEDLRSSLSAALPDYMVPSAFVILPALPLTPNGKVDLKALPEPDRAASAPASSGQFVEPAGAIEPRLAGIWKDLLRLERVGANDNFFDLGGHSLLVVQLHQRIRDELRQEVRLLDLFKHPTIRRLARHMESSLRPAPASTVSASQDVAERAGNRNKALERQRELARRHRPS